MNKMTRVPNKNQEKYQEGVMPDSGKGAQPARAPHRSGVWGMACLGLALGCLGFVQLATAHSGLDPETEKITEKLTKDPDNVDLLVRRGQVYRSNGKFLESLLDLERAWLLDRENRTVVLHHALTLSALGRNKEAEAALDYFLQEESDPKRVFALAERAHIRARTGRVELAIDDFTSAIQLQPTIELYLNRGQLQESLGKLEAAAAGYHDGLAKLGNAILLKKGLIRMQIAQKQYGEALALVDDEIARSSVKTPWYMQQGEILALMGQPDASHLAYERALSEANRVLEKRPTAMQLLARAEVYHAMGRMKEAKRDLRAAVQRAPHFAEASALLKKLESR
jgi:tetratricopeptide (TPR) repeat protein